MEKEKYYCENCFEEELDDYVIDNLGSIFCSEKCAEESLEYKDIENINLNK